MPTNRQRRRHIVEADAAGDQAMSLDARARGLRNRRGACRLFRHGVRCCGQHVFGGARGVLADAAEAHAQAAQLGLEKSQRVALRDLLPGCLHNVRCDVVSLVPSDACGRDWRSAWAVARRARIGRRGVQMGDHRRQQIDIGVARACDGRGLDVLARGTCGMRRRVIRGDGVAWRSIGVRPCGRLGRCGRK